MGTPMASAFADLYLSDLEDKLFHETIVQLQDRRSIKFKKQDQVFPFITWLQLYKNRCVNDAIAFITVPSQIKSFIALLNNMDPNIQWETTTSDISLNFLDIEIYKQLDFNLTGKLSTRIYQKPMNAYLYLQPKSLHPSHIFPSCKLEEYETSKEFIQTTLKPMEPGPNSKKDF
jgi:hypothetical protein